MHILVVDDTSPDGTAEEVRSMMSTRVNLHLLTGSGAACIRGMDHALRDLGADAVFELRAGVLQCFESPDPGAACGANGETVSSFTDACWLEEFRADIVTPTHFRFVAGGETVGVAAGLGTQSRHRLLQGISGRFWLHKGQEAWQWAREELYGFQE